MGCSCGQTQHRELLVGRRGRQAPVEGVRELIVAPHSHKPDEQYERIELVRRSLCRVVRRQRWPG
jgi:hypothetical protein